MAINSDKIRKDCHQSQSSYDMTTSPATSRVNSRVNKLRWSLYNCYDVEFCNLQYLLGIETIFTKNLSEFGWVFANLFRVKELFKVASELERSSVSRILIFLLSSLRSFLT